MKHLSTLIAVKNLTIIQFTKIIQDLFYLDEFILDSLIIHLENCTIYHDESAIAFCIQYQNNDYEYIFNEKKQNIYLSINKRNNQFIDLITYLNKYHFLNNNHFSYIQPNIKNMNDLNQVIEFIENKTILPVIYLNISLKDFKNEILTEIQSTAYILTSEDENFHQAFQNHFHLRNNSYILYLNHEFQKISFLKKESPQEFIEKVKINLADYYICPQICMNLFIGTIQHQAENNILIVTYTDRDGNECKICGTSSEEWYSRTSQISGRYIHNTTTNGAKIRLANIKTGKISVIPLHKFVGYYVYNKL